MHSLRSRTPAGRLRFAPASVGRLRHPRFEPLLIAVRGWRPEPLDEGSGDAVFLPAAAGTGCYHTAAY